MNPSDFDGFDGDEGGLSPLDLPPSLRARQPAPMNPAGGTVQANTSAHGGAVAAVPAYRAQPPPMALAQATQIPPMPPQGPAQGFGAPPTPGQPTDSSPWLFLGATALIGALGWWAYSKMEKEKKFRVGPPQLGRGRFRDDRDDDRAGGFDDLDDGYDDADDSLDAYADVAGAKKATRSHEKGGIKMVKG